MAQNGRRRTRADIVSEFVIPKCIPGMARSPLQTRGALCRVMLPSVSNLMSKTSRDGRIFKVADFRVTTANISKSRKQLYSVLIASCQDGASSVRNACSYVTGIRGED